MKRKTLILIASLSLGALTLSSAVGAENLAEQKGAVTADKASNVALIPNEVNFRFTPFGPK